MALSPSRWWFRVDLSIARYPPQITSINIAVILRWRQRHDVGRPLVGLLIGRLRDRIRSGNDEESQDQG